MLKLQPIEFFLRGLPEGFLFILSIYAFSKTKIDKKRYVASSIICAIAFFSIRMLPISYGVHTILSIGVTILLGSTINGIDVIKVVKSILIYVIIQFVTEGINIFIIQNILNVDINEVFSNPIVKTLYGIPSLMMASIIIVIYYLTKLRKGELINV